MTDKKRRIKKKTTTYEASIIYKGQSSQYNKSNLKYVVPVINNQ